MSVQQAQTGELTGEGADAIHAVATEALLAADAYKTARHGETEEASGAFYVFCRPFPGLREPAPLTKYVVLPDDAVENAMEADARNWAKENGVFQAIRAQSKRKLGTPRGAKVEPLPRDPMLVLSEAVFPWAEVAAEYVAEQKPAAERGEESTGPAGSPVAETPAPEGGQVRDEPGNQGLPPKDAALVRGVSLRDAALMLTDQDSKLAGDIIRRWQRMRNPRLPPSVGCCCSHEQRKRYAPSALCDFLEKSGDAEVSRKLKLRKRLTDIAREPRRE